MKIKTDKLRWLILYVMIFYALNKMLFDFLFGDIGKIIYYFIVAIGAMMWVFLIMPTKKEYRFIFLLYSIHSIIIILNGFLCASSLQRSRGYIQYISFTLVLFSLLYYINGYKCFDKMLNVIRIWSIIISILAVCEYILQKSILPRETTGIYYFFDGSSSYRALVFQGSPMILGVILGSSSLISIYFYHMSREKKYFFSIIINLIGIFCTGSRGPLIITVCSIIFMYLNFYTNRLIRRKQLIRIIVLVSIIIIFICFVILSGSNFRTGITSIDFFITRFSSTFNFKTEWGNLERLRRWSYYINKFLEKPYMGYGIASTSAEVVTNINITNHGITTESGMLARLVETGVLGAITYYYYVFMVIKMATKKYFNNNNRRIIILCIVFLFFLEDIILQISLDLICNFWLWMIITIGISINDLNRGSLYERDYGVK